jgi:hypothetical protein
MPQLTVAFGVLLILIGVVAYLGTGRESATALLPAVAGIPILLAGWMAMRPGREFQGLVVAAVLTAILALGSLRGVMILIGGEVTSASVINTGIFLLSVAYLVPSINAIRTMRQQQGSE